MNTIALQALLKFAPAWIIAVAPQLGVALIAALLSARPAAAQQYPACQPPAAGEFLVLVVTRSNADQERVRSVLPSNANATLCDYFQQNTVVRIGGYQTEASATSWRDFFIGQGLQADVARPSQVATPPNNFPAQPNFPTQPTQQPTFTGVYNPQLLGAGYAVLVNYNNQPETAMRVQQSLNRQIGLASYGQRPYLLAAHTTDSNIADTTLRSLISQGYNATIVNSDQVFLLTPAVSPQ